MVYINMLSRPYGYDQRSRKSQSFDLRYKFNQILSDAAADQGHRVMSIRSCSTNDCFDRMGNLNNKGKVNFWMEFDNLIERFNRGEINLRPKKFFRGEH